MVSLEVLVVKIVISPTWCVKSSNSTGFLKAIVVELAHKAAEVFGFKGVSTARCSAAARRQDLQHEELLMNGYGFTEAVPGDRRLGRVVY